MACEEGIDLDALADLIDEDDDFDTDMPLSNRGSSALSQDSHTEQATTSSNVPQQTNSIPQKADIVPQETDTKASIKPKIRQLKPISLDMLFNKTLSTDEQEASCSQSKESKSLVRSGDADSSDDENKTYLTESGKMIKKQLKFHKSYDDKPQRLTIKTWKDGEQTDRKRSFSASAGNESYSVDQYSGIRIVNPLVSHNTMKERMCGRKMIKMSCIRTFMRNGDIEGDWVTIGVLVGKTPPKSSKNGKTFSIWKMTDLRDTEKLVSVFLFGAVHTQHWKTAIGTVVGILNPSFLPNKDGYKNSELSLSVDHAGKFMIIGTSKDFGHCRGKRRDGTSCTAIINKSECEYCAYHVTKEYKKLSSKRVELQASFSGSRPSLKNKVLKGQNVMYGGQLFCNPSVGPPQNSRKSKDKLMLNNLTLKRKAEEMERTEKALNVKNLSEVHGIETDKTIKSQSQFINQQLSTPSVGSRNLFHHLVNKEKAEIIKKEVVSVTPKELLKMHEQQLRAKRLKLDQPQLGATSKQSFIRKDAQPTFPNTLSPLPNVVPQIGRGLKPGDEVCLDVIGAPRKAITREELAKLKAISKIKQKGPIKQQNPNAVKGEKTPESTAKIQQCVEKDVSKVEDTPPPKPETTKKGLLGSINLSAEKLEKILNQKSSHSFELEVEELERQELYFRALEKKEQMEEKMASTMEMVCDVVSCKICKYTAHKPTDLCKSENHPLRTHKAVKRFFVCTNCKRRTCAFTKLPTRPCRNCGESKFERTSMMKPRSGPKLENETLKIRGDEIKFLNSLKN